MATTITYFSKDNFLYFYQKLKLKLQSMQTSIDGKVDKVDGKGLSTNDYTTEEKTKLAGVEAQANKTVINNTLTSDSTTEALSAAQGKALADMISDAGGGDMMKATYDTDDDGIVDNSEALEGHPASYFAAATDLEDYLETDGDGSAVTATFTQAGTRANLVSGETLATIFGKLMKWFSDLASVAFSGSYADLSNKPTINNVEVSGTKTLADYGIQEAGEYLTEEDLADYATETYVDTAVSDLVNSAPAALDTLKELSDALGGDANFATTMTNALANKVNTADLVEMTNAEIDTIMDAS